MLLNLGSALLSTGWLVMQLSLAFLFFRFFFRVAVRRGLLHFPNPFQPGWKQLHQQYGITHIIRLTEWMSGTIGAVKYEKGLKYRFETRHWVVQNMDISGLLVQIPYVDMEVLQIPAPFQATRFSETEYTSGIFQVGGVKVELPAYWADQLLKHISAASVAEGS